MVVMRLLVIVIMLLALPQIAIAKRVAEKVDNANGIFRLNANKSRKLKIDAAQLDAAVERPAWIPAYAFTNDNMICYYGVKMLGLKHTWRLPNHGSMARMHKDISVYWKGPCPKLCVLRVEPDSEAPSGNFKFHTIGHPEGPRGWLQATGIKDETGWQYRYWFDQPNTSHSVQ